MHDKFAMGRIEGQFISLMLHGNSAKPLAGRGPPGSAVSLFSNGSESSKKGVIC